MVKSPYLVLWWTVLMTSELNVESLPTPTETTGGGENPSGTKSPHPQNIIHPEPLQGAAEAQDQEHNVSIKLDKQEEIEKQSEQSRQTPTAPPPTGENTFEKHDSATEFSNNEKEENPLGIVPPNEERPSDNSFDSTESSVPQPTTEENTLEKHESISESSNNEIKESTSETVSPNEVKPSGNSFDDTQSPVSPSPTEENTLEKHESTSEFSNNEVEESTSETVSSNEVKPPDNSFDDTQTPLSPPPTEENTIETHESISESSNNENEENTLGTVSLNEERPSGNSFDSTETSVPPPTTEENTLEKHESTSESSNNDVDENTSKTVSTNELEPSTSSLDSLPKAVSPPGEQNTFENPNIEPKFSNSELEQGRSEAVLSDELKSSSGSQDVYRNREPSSVQSETTLDETTSKDESSYSITEEISSRPDSNNEIKPLFRPQELTPHSMDYKIPLAQNIFQKVSKDQQLKQLQTDFLQLGDDSPHLSESSVSVKPSAQNKVDLVRRSYSDTNRQHYTQKDTVGPERSSYIPTYPYKKYSQSGIPVPRENYLQESQANQHASNNIHIEPKQRNLKYWRYYLQPMSNSHKRSGKIFVLKKIPVYKENTNNINHKQVEADSEELEKRFGHNNKLVVVKPGGNHRSDNMIKYMKVPSRKLYAYRPAETLSNRDADKVINIEYNHNGLSRKFIFTSPPKVRDHHPSGDVNGMPNGYKKPAHIVRIQYNVHGRTKQADNAANFHPESLTSDNIADLRSMKLLNNQLKLLASHFPGLNLHEVVGF